jgi:integrase
MSVTDRWHKSHPRAGDGPCKCGRGKNLLYPTAEHMKGDRWQVRWYDLDGKQRSLNFALRSPLGKDEAKDPDVHADAFDAKVTAELNSGTYIAPSAAKGTFGEYAKGWLESRTHDEVTHLLVERQLRLHILEDAAGPGSGRTASGGPALGQHTWAALGRQPSLTQRWIAGLKLAPVSAIGVIRTVSSIFIAAMDDGLIGRNPTQSKSVSRPDVVPKKARPWTPAIVSAVADGLGLKEERYEIIPYLGAATGMRQGEMLGLADIDVGDPEVFRRTRVVHVRRQVRMVGAALCFAPVKNKREHAAPVPEEFAELLIAYMERFPPAAVTLPWVKPGGEPVTHRLVVTRPDGRPLNRNTFNEDFWKPALCHARIIPLRKPGANWASARDQGCHRLRHTAVSQWLHGGASVTDVAEWIGDSVEMVYKTYAHMMPGADEKGRAAMAGFFAQLTPSARFVPHGDREGKPPQVVALSGDFV